MTILRKSNLALGILLAVLTGVRSTPAGDLYPGNVLVTVDSLDVDGYDAVLQIDLTDGWSEPISEDGLLHGPKGIALGPARNEIYVVDNGVTNALVLQIDCHSGRQTIITTLSERDRLTGITCAANGHLYVSGHTHDSAKPWVKEIDPSSGIVLNTVGNTVGNGSHFRKPMGIATAPYGEIFVADMKALPERKNQGAVLTASGLRVSSRGFFGKPVDLVAYPNGLIAVLDQWGYARPIEGNRYEVAPSVIMVDLDPEAWRYEPMCDDITNQTVVTYDGDFLHGPAPTIGLRPTAIALDLKGELLVVQEGQIIRVDPSLPHLDMGANQTVVYDDLDHIHKRKPILVGPTDMVVIRKVKSQVEIPWEIPGWLEDYEELEELLREGFKKAG